MHVVYIQIIIEIYGAFTRSFWPRAERSHGHRSFNLGDNLELSLARVKHCVAVLS